MKTSRSALRRFPKRGHFDRQIVDAILDEGLLAHVAFEYDGRPTIVPTLHARAGDNVLVHGSSAGRLAKACRRSGGIEVCLSVIILDGLVMARSALQHSVNYRSVILYGRMTELSSDRLEAFEAFMEGVIPGRWSEVRPPTRSELKATAVFALPIQEGAAKIRQGDPEDLEEDAGLEGWGGVLPLRLVASPVITDPSLRASAARVPEHVLRLVERFAPNSQP